jgi:hypothetical protein
MSLSTEGDLGDVPTSVSAPRWIAASLEVNEGRDPLGLQTTTQDRLMPILLPGLLELTRRARYFSFHAFLLDEYQRRRLPADGKALAAFIRRREWDFGLAVQRCTNCESSPVGAQRLGALSRGLGPFPRGESVESAFGGYGLYYRSPMAEFGIVARAGTLLGDQPIPIDVLYGHARARRIAEEFRIAVKDTVYYRESMWTNHDLPAEVVDEYADVACLCRLRERDSEREAVHDAIFGVDAPASAAPESHVSPAVSLEAGDTEAAKANSSGAGVVQRRRSVGHYLTLMRSEPAVVESEGAYREALWNAAAPYGDAHSVVAGEWAALIAKDVWQEVLCSVWSEFCRAGLARTRELGAGLTWDEVRVVAAGLTAGPPFFAGDLETRDLVHALENGTLAVPDASGAVIEIAEAPLESLRRLTAGLDTATSGLVVVLELARRTAARTGPGWDHASQVASGWQRSVAAVIHGLRDHLAEYPAVADTLWWLVSQFVVPVHERIAYSKLPEFTFRFRWEEGLLRFYDHGAGRFPLAAIRRDSLASVTRDLGLWDSAEGGPAALTDRGERFVLEALT